MMNDMTLTPLYDQAVKDTGINPDSLTHVDMTFSWNRPTPKLLPVIPKPGQLPVGRKRKRKS